MDRLEEARCQPPSLLDQLGSGFFGDLTGQQPLLVAFALQGGQRGLATPLVEPGRAASGLALAVLCAARPARGPDAPARPTRLGAHELGDPVEGASRYLFLAGPLTGSLLAFIASISAGLSSWATAFGSIWFCTPYAR